MHVILTAPSGRRWKLSPIDSGLCFQVFKEPIKKTGRNGKPIKAEWISCDRYPSGLSHAVASTIELMAADSDDPVIFECNDPQEIMEAIHDWIGQISYEVVWDTKKQKKKK